MSTPAVKPRVDITSMDVSPLKVDNSEATKLDMSGERQESQQEIQQSKNTLSTTKAVLIGAAVATAVKVSRDNKAQAPTRTKPEVPPTKIRASSKNRMPSSSQKKSNKEKVKRANSKRSSSSRKSSSRKSSSRRR
ncbi:hypothetical protein BIZ37_27240 [Photobacterium sp. BZF1]|uniref:hypothetical protein n=1 Tax=Photobacterium sp. BZF1 TaxID=1904457 RepID=UPI0016534919|nr:hypothetical protein [Photobacterium sp. BZF1]MBC7006259.1 hypothetical protein [Photobacterium sp. BZF1]